MIYQLYGKLGSLHRSCNYSEQIEEHLFKGDAFLFVEILKGYEPIP